MKHLKTFENYVGSLNEATSMGPKLTRVWNKYKKSGIEATPGAELQDLFDTLDPEELGEDFVNVIKSLGKKPSELVSFSTANGGDEEFDDFMEDIKKAGLTHKYWFEDHGGPAVVVVNA
jgi:hypothetical protein